MKKVVFIFMLGLGFAWNCHAQTWTYVQDSVLTYCNPQAPTSTCSFSSGGNIVPTSAGSVQIVLVNTPANVHITSVTDTNGGSWQLCPASSCHIFNSTLGANVDLAYNLAGNAGTIGLTINLSGSSGSYFGGGFVEIMPPTGSTASFDTAGTTAPASCTGQSCSGVALTLTATDAVLETINGNANLAWNSWSSPFFTATNGDGFALNATTGALAAPGITVKTPANGFAMASIAFKSSLGSFTPPSTAMSLVNSTATHAPAINCNPSCTVSIPSPAIGSGHLLYLQSGTLNGTHITSVSGGGAWVTPSGCVIATGSDTLSCAYVLSSAAGATSLSITMSGNSAVAFNFSEVASTGGPFTFDVLGSTTNSASLNPGGVTLTPTGTNDAIFQAIFVPGGTSGMTWYPLSNNWEFFQNNAAQGILLNASNSPRPFYNNEQKNVTVVTGVAFRTGTALAPAPPTGLKAVVN